MLLTCCELNKLVEQRFVQLLLFQPFVASFPTFLRCIAARTIEDELIFAIKQQEFFLCFIVEKMWVNLICDFFLKNVILVTFLTFFGTEYNHGLCTTLIQGQHFLVSGSHINAYRTVKLLLNCLLPTGKKSSNKIVILIRETQRLQILLKNLVGTSYSCSDV